jgi:hypothetical protein
MFKNMLLQLGARGGIVETLLGFVEVDHGPDGFEVLRIKIK